MSVQGGHEDVRMYYAATGENTGKAPQSTNGPKGERAVDMKTNQMVYVFI